MKKNAVLLLLSLVTLAFSNKARCQTTAGSLPVVLVDFNVKSTTDNKVSLTWTTQQEVNSDYYSIEKSTDAVAWKPIGHVKAMGNSSIPVNYAAEDPFPLKGNNYYRICVRNLNGLTGYTIAKIVNMAITPKICIYPNPSLTGFVNIVLAEVPQNDWTLRVINNSGHVMITKKYNRLFTNINFSMAQYPNGNYTIQTSDGKNTQIRRLIIIHP
ncbi:MAG: T9SS type A sorting domain-containing protein [Chitinophagaceae bacterium]